MPTIPHRRSCCGRCGGRGRSCCGRCGGSRGGSGRGGGSGGRGRS